MAALHLQQFFPLGVKEIAGHLQRHFHLHPADLPFGHRTLYLAQGGDGLGLGAFDPAAAGAVRAGEIGALSQGRLDSLPTHLQQSELADASYRYPSLVPFQGILEGFLHLADVLAIAHVDQVDDDQPPQIAQAKLPRRFDGGLKVGLVSGRLDVLLAGHFPGIDVHRHQRLGAVDDDGAAGGEGHLVFADRFDLLFDLVAGKDRALLLMQLHQAGEFGHDLLEKIFGFLVNAGVVDQHFIHLGGEIVPNGTDDQIRFLVNQGGRPGEAGLLADLFPDPHQVVEVALQFLFLLADAGGADDVAHVRRQIEGRHRLFQLLALAFLLDFARHAFGVAVGHQHHEAAGEGEEGRQGRPFGPALLLDHLNEKLLPPPQNVGDALPAVVPVPLAVTEIGRVDFAHLQKTETFPPVIDKGGLQPLFHPDHRRLVNVAP